ncbi:MAG: CRISPR-associated protein Cas4 [Thermoguttaceae bacterium]|jgi:CRISPR-associated protein Cas1
MTCSDVARETDVPDLVPARMLNEFCYYPRLACLEWVQGEWAHNLETLEGRFGHRRVHRPLAGDVPAPGENGDGGQPDDEPSELEAIHTRSLMLSAPEEGLVAKMDLVDISAGEVIPVGYKRRRLPDVDGGAWETERVRLCAQGLILPVSALDRRRRTGVRNAFLICYDVADAKRSRRTYKKM